MVGIVDAAVERARHAVGLVLDEAVAVRVDWLAAAVALHVLAQAVRIRGWWTILRAAYPESEALRPRDVRTAYFAGAGLNGLLPARAGDLVKFAILRRRIPGSSYSTLAATTIPETTFESFCGAALVVWMLLRGFLPVPLVRGEVPSLDVSWCLDHPILASALAAVLGAATAGAIVWLRRRALPVFLRVRQGFAIFASPRRFITGVATWQAAGRAVRLCSLMCFLAAFGLPATPAAALLVMAAQGGGRIIPLAPVSAGLRIAMLSYGLVEVGGQAVDAAAVTVFTFGVSAVLFVVMLSISLALVARELGARSPRAAMREARARLDRTQPAAGVSSV